MYGKEISTHLCLESTCPAWSFEAKDVLGTSETPVCKCQQWLSDQKSVFKKEVIQN